MTSSKKKYKYKNIKHNDRKISRKNKILKGGSDPVNLIPLIHLEPKYIIDNLPSNAICYKVLNSTRISLSRSPAPK
jgi:hypothetical protein